MKLYYLLFLLIFTGCDEQTFVRPKPTVTINIEENTDKVFAKITYKDHKRISEKDIFYVDIKTSEEISEYCKQLNLVIHKLQELEDLMRVKEQTTHKVEVNKL